MLKKIKASINHGVNLVKHAFKELKHKRSPNWRSFRNEFIKNNPNCAACNTTIRLNAHHIIPFHIDPSRELDNSNLITLCMSKKECHYKLGHGGETFKKYVLNVKTFAKQALDNPDNYDKIAEMAKKESIS